MLTPELYYKYYKDKSNFIKDWVIILIVIILIAPVIFGVIKQNNNIIIIGLLSFFIAVFTIGKILMKYRIKN